MPTTLPSKRQSTGWCASEKTYRSSTSSTEIYEPYRLPQTALAAQLIGSANSKIGAAKRCAGTLLNAMALEGAILALAEVAGWRFGLTSARRLRLFADPAI
jgi:hypothetical protein